MSNFSKFLNAGSRVDALANRVSPQDDEKILALKMIAVTINSEDNIENILYKLFEDEKAYEKLEKFELKN